MRFMMLVRADADAESGEVPSEELIADMAAFNEEMADAGVMLAGEGLLPSSEGARVSFSGGEPAVTEGPFPTEELVSGFWMLRVASLEEAIEWARRVPFEEGAVELRRVAEEEDFGEEFTPELREREARLREELESRS